MKRLSFQKPSSPDTETRRPLRTSSDSGQTMIFMIMLLVILASVILWNFDLHKVLHLKSRTQNAGDAAALAAARWQGITLNLIGDLNIIQAIALSNDELEAADIIPALQARLCYAGPAAALLAAQQAAKQNRIFLNHLFSDYLAEHAENIRNDYPEIFVEPYPHCWEEYADMLAAIAQEGMVAGPDNAQFYIDYIGNHFLLELSFYYAIAAPHWCWFKWCAYDLLRTYNDYRNWPDLPEITQQEPDNSEIFGLGLSLLSDKIPLDLAQRDALARQSEERGLGTLPDTIDQEEGQQEIEARWMVYLPSRWRTWDEFDIDGSDPFPAAGAVRPQFDYLGADAAVRVEAVTQRLTPQAADTKITFTAAAKPFGWLEDGSEQINPAYYSIVLPAFRDVRLIPVDTSSAPEGGSYDVEWRIHVRDHLPPYMETGPSVLVDNCWYCDQLKSWENREFRQRGRAYLTATNSAGQLLHPCVEPSGPGPSPGGGRRRAH